MFAVVIHDPDVHNNKLLLKKISLGPTIVQHFIPVSLYLHQYNFNILNILYHLQIITPLKYIFRLPLFNIGMAVFYILCISLHYFEGKVPVFNISFIS